MPESPAPDEYDLLLAALPTPLFAGLAWSWVGAVGPALALGAGSLLAVAPLAYALFLSPPA
ncbi:hypothetical protein [Halorarius halobius]|uniref:hypothetical protein n=1 Tax=Halorarius halobius TaxID=2962671 RepID=UPI0020CDEB10|nr:hypothetical protein [Halorarius halobius]